MRGAAGLFCQVMRWRLEDSLGSPHSELLTFCWGPGCPWGHHLSFFSQLAPRWGVQQGQLQVRPSLRCGEYEVWQSSVPQPGLNWAILTHLSAALGVFLIRRTGSQPARPSSPIPESNHSWRRCPRARDPSSY